MASRATRYLITITMKDGYVETGAFSRRPDAIKRAAVIRATWPNAATVVLVDTYTATVL